MPIETAVAQANEKNPEKATIDGINLQPYGKDISKFPTEVKKLAVNMSAVGQSEINPDKLNATTHIESEKSITATKNMMNRESLSISICTLQNVARASDRW
jgi:hypothetical protein